MISNTINNISALKENYNYDLKILFQVGLVFNSGLIV